MYKMPSPDAVEVMVIAEPEYDPARLDRKALMMMGLAGAQSFSLMLLMLQKTW